MADSKLASPRSGTVSPPPNCAICLGTCTNKCYSDSCMHEFCFKCLLEWSKIKAECPLCKQAFKSIIHNIKSINEYDEHVVENITVEDNTYLENASLIYLPPATPPGLHQYHFQTTFTVDSHGEHAIQQMLLTHPLLTIGNFTPDRFTSHRRRRGDTSTTFRRSIYNQNLWVYAPPDITGRYRDVSPNYFRNNPAARTRLVPWLNRELNALLYENTQHVMHLVDVIMDHLLRHHICSYMFRSLLSEYLGNKTDHFIHEFYNFMRSPFDMIGYDRTVIYTERRPSPIPYIDVSDYDSDVILVSATSSNQQENNGTDPVIINLVDTDSDELIIVSEERNGTSSRFVEDDHNRKPVLPLKLRIKNRHTSKERRQRAKKRHRDDHAISKTASSSSSSSTSSSNTSTTSSTTSSSTSSSSSSDTECEFRKYQEKKMQRKLSKRKRRDNSSYNRERNKSAKTFISSSSDNEDDLPLSSFASKRKRARHSENRRHKSHTVTSVKDQTKKLRHFVDKLISDHSNHQRVAENPEPDTAGSVLETTSDNIVLKKEERSNSGYESNNNSDDSFYSDRKPYVKSKIRDLREDNKHKAGPSSGRLRNILRKEESSNLWYSRPCIYDSDSSEN